MQEEGRGSDAQSSVCTGSTRTHSTTTGSAELQPLSASQVPGSGAGGQRSLDTEPVNGSFRLLFRPETTKHANMQRWETKPHYWAKTQTQRVWGPFILSLPSVPASRGYSWEGSGGLDLAMGSPPSHQ